MNDYFDFFQYPYFISYSFDEDKVFAKYARFLAVHDRKEPIFDGEKEFKASVLYNPVTGAIIRRGCNAVKGYTRKEAEDQDIVYVENVFMELHNIFIAESEPTTMHRNIVLNEAISILQGSQKDGHNPFTKCHFSFIVPTFWDLNIQEDVLRPLYIKAGLILEGDHHKRLLFATQLDACFKHIFCDERRDDFARNKRYLMCRYKFLDEEMKVDLDLLTTETPSFNILENSDYTPFLRNIDRFQIPLDPSLENSIEAYVKGISSREIEQLKMLIRRYNSHKKLLSTPKISYYGDLSSHLIFKQFLSPKQWDLFEVEISRVQSITLKDLHDETFNFIEQTFLKSLKELLKGLYGGKKLVVVLVSRDTKQKDSDAHYYEILVDWLQEMLKEIGEFPFHFTLMNNGEKVNNDNMMDGAISHFKQHINLQYKINYDLDILPERLYKSSVALFMNKKPFYTVNIAISEDVNESTVVSVGQDRCVKNYTVYRDYNIQPLSKFFHQLAEDRKPLLYISNRMKLLMGSVLPINCKVEAPKTGLRHDIHRSNQKVKGYLHEYILKDNPSVKKLLDNPEIITMLSNIEGRQDDANDRLTTVYQKEYNELFLAMYTGYLYKLVMNKINEDLEDDWKNKNIIQQISVEKRLLDNIFGSKEEIQKLLPIGDFGDPSKKSNPIRVTIQEENCILPAIAKYLKQDIKQYFVVAQFHQSYIQLTLRQVIKASLLENFTSSVFIKDDVIPLKNPFDILCRNIWCFITNNDDFNAVNSCSFHKGTTIDCFSLENYLNIFPRWKQLFQSMFESKFVLNVDTKIDLPMRGLCDCKFQVSLRGVIEIGLKPILRDTVHSIIGAINDEMIFGNYGVDFMLVIDNMFAFNPNSSIYKIYTIILEREIMDIIRLKKIRLLFHVLPETQSQFLRPVINKELYSYDSLIYGNLQLVSGETYVIYIRGFQDRFSAKKVPNPFLFCDRESHGARFGGDANTAKFILKTGQPISETPFTTQFKVELQNEIGMDSDSQYTLTLVLARLKHTESTFEGEIISLDEVSYDDVYEFQIIYNYVQNFQTAIRFEVKSLPYNSSNRFTLSGTEVEQIFVTQRPSVAFM